MIKSSAVVAMKQFEVVFALSLVLTPLSRAAADGYEFSLDDVEATNKPAHGKPAPAPVANSKQAIADALGAVRWGMTKADLLKVLKAQIRAEFEQRIKVERDIMRQDSLYQAAQEQARRLTENWIEFEAGKTGWDVSPIGKEFTRGNREAMLVVTNKSSRDIYFFIQGKLWKWYRELAPETLNASDPAEALTVLTERFGKGKAQKDRLNEANVAYTGTTWTDGATRVTAMLRGSDTCLILEDLRTLENLPVLRHNVETKPKDHVASTIDHILLTDEELKARAN